MTNVTDNIADKIIKVFLGDEEELLEEIKQFRKDLFAEIKKTSNAEDPYGGIDFDMSPYTFAYNPHARGVVLETLHSIFTHVHYCKTGFNQAGVRIGMNLSVGWWEKEKEKEAKEPTDLPSLIEEEEKEDPEDEWSDTYYIGKWKDWTNQDHSEMGEGQFFQTYGGGPVGGWLVHQGKLWDVHQDGCGKPYIFKEVKNSTIQLRNQNGRDQIRIVPTLEDVPTGPTGVANEIVKPKRVTGTYRP